MSEMENNPKLIELYKKYNNFGSYLGMNFKIIRPGEIEYYLTIEQKHLSTPKAGHGGVVAALMDGLLGVTALSAVCGENRIVSTVEFKINFLNPTLLNDQLIGKAKIDKQGKKLLIISGEIFASNRKNVLIAKAIGTFNSYPAEKAGMVLA